MSCVSLLLVRAQFRGITTPISSLIKNSPRIWASHESSRFLSLTACLDKREGTRKQRVTPETSYLLPTVVRPPHTDEILRDLRHFSTAQSLLDKSQELKPEDDKTPKKVGIVAKFKQLFRDYWYVLVPVHCVTSVVWFSSFYILVKSGIDVTTLLSSFGVSEAYLEKIAHSEWSYVALATACYKLATPARYTVTVGGSTLTIKYLKDWGYLKTSGEVAQEIRVQRDKVKVEWEKYAEKRRRRKKVKKVKRLSHRFTQKHKDE